MTSRIGQPIGVGQILIDAALNTKTVPGLSFVGDTTTGVFRDASGNISVSIADTLLLTINTSGELVVPTGYEAGVTVDEVIANKKYVDDAITTAIATLPSFNVTSTDLDDFLVGNGSGDFVDKTPAEVRTILGLVAGGAGDIWVEKAGDAMDSGANITFSGGGEILGLPGTPSAADAAASKAYVDSLTVGLTWVTPVYYIDFLGDGQGGAVTKDLQNPLNDTNAFITSVEHSDMQVVASGVAVNWTAVGVTGNTLVTSGDAGDVMRWDGDPANGGLDPEWERVGHISDPADFSDCQAVGVHQAPVRWGAQVDTVAVPGGFLTGFTTPIVELVVQDIDSDVSPTEHDAIWGLQSTCGTPEVVQITTADHTSVAGSDFFTMYLAVGSNNLSPTLFVDPTNTVPHTGGSVYVWFTKDAVGADPTPALHVEGIGPVPVVTGDSAAVIAGKVKSVLDAHRVQLGGPLAGDPVYHSVTLPGATNIVEVTDNHSGRTAAPVAGIGLAGWGYAETVQGACTGVPNNTSFYVSNVGSFNFGNQYVYQSTGDDWVLFGGQGAAILPGIGLSQAGQFFNVNLGAGIFERPIDGVGIELYSETAGSIILTLDGTTRDTTGTGSTASTASKLALKANTSQFTQATELALAAAGVTETELNTSVAGAGLGGGAGTPLEVNVDGAAGVVISSDAVSLSGVPSSALATDYITFDSFDGAPTGTTNISLGSALALNSGTGMNISIAGSTATFQPDVHSVHGRVGAVIAASADYTAAQISYNNLSSGLTATEVQSAIDEIVSGGIGSFTGLTDTPGTYAGSGLYFLRVNVVPNAVEFVNMAASTGTTGADLIGVDPTAITNSSNTTVQDVLEDLDAAIGGGALTNRIQDADNNTYVETDLSAGDDNTIRMRVGDNSSSWSTALDNFQLSAAGGLSLRTSNAVAATIAGSNMTITSGAGNTTGASGSIFFYTGDQTAAGATGDSGNFEVRTGRANASTNSGTLLLETGSCSSGAAGDIILRAGNGTTDGVVRVDVLNDGVGPGTTPGTLQIVGVDGAITTHNINIKAPNSGSFTADYTLVLPPNDGNLNEVLTTDGSGGLSWAAAGVSTFIGLTDTPSAFTGLPEISSVAIPNGATAGLSFTPGGTGDYFVLNSSNDGTTYNVWYNVSGGNTPPAGPNTPLVVNITAADTDLIIAAATAAAINAVIDFTSPVPGSNIATITNAANGVTTNIVDATMPVGTLFGTAQEGVDDHGVANELLQVNSASNALEFVNPSAVGRTNFIDLDDTPAVYAGGALDAGKHLRVDAPGTAIEFVAPTFIEGTDTPGVYAGGAADAGKHLRVAAGGSSIEFALPTFLELNDTPAAYTSAGQHLRINGGNNGVEFAAPTFLEDTDTPSAYAAGDAGKSVVVNAGETAVEFAHRQPVTTLEDQTLDGTPTELSTDGAGGGYYNIASGDAHVLDINVIGQQNTGALVAAWNVKVVIKNTGGTTALVGTSVTTVITNSPGWSVAVTADDSNDRLAVTVTGAGGTTINWKASITATVAP